MSTQNGRQEAALTTERQSRLLFIASCIALVATAMTFAVRGDILGTWGTEFALDKTSVGWITGMAFWGFALSVIIGGAIVDFIGLKSMLVVAFATHVTGIVVTIFAGGFWTLFLGTLLIGLGNGAVEAACNPLVATAYPNQKTAKLNLFHVWFPGGIVIGGLAAYFLTTIGLGWQVKMAIILIPTLVYGAMFLGMRIPETERVAAGVSTGGMFREALRPMFLVLAFAMLLTASTELGTNQWLPSILTTTAAVSGILVLVWINGLMAVGRFFGHSFLGRISPIGLLIGSAAASLVGLLLLSVANSAILAFVAATVFAVGICYFWPTMLGVTAERFPAGGAWLLGIMGGIGNISVAITMPILGGIYDTSGPTTALRSMAILPLILLLIFGFFWFRDKARGGYKAENLLEEDRGSRETEGASAGGRTAPGQV
ncbi:MAG: MFS transporter [Rubrobacteraceae bacterium]